MGELPDDKFPLNNDRFDLARASCQEVLRAATQGPHERLHHHAGFSSVKDGTITRSDYRTLLIRLYGFYLPFERAAATDHSRTRWLKRDLNWMGVGAQRLSRSPLCPDIPRLNSPRRRIGALYVVEGSALGGRQLGRGLDRLLGEEAVEGRRFFTGRGAGTGAAWRGFLDQLASAGNHTAGRTLLVSGATETFELFETWLTGWRDAG